MTLALTDERLRELAAQADAAADLMSTDLAHFMLEGRKAAVVHYDNVIRGQRDIAAIARAALEIRAVLRTGDASSDALDEIEAIIGGTDT